MSQGDWVDTGLTHKRLVAFNRGKILRLSSLNLVWSRIARTLFSAMRARKTEPALCGLSDHLLKDIGMRRDQIDYLPRGGHGFG